VSCVLRPRRDVEMRGCHRTTQRATPRLWVMSPARQPLRRSARDGARRQRPLGSRRGSALEPRKQPAGFKSDGQCEISASSGKASGRRARGRARRPALSLLVASRTGSAKSLCFQGRCLEDVREDLRFTASSWKT